MIKGIKEFIKYKDLLLNLTKKELQLKYKNSILGFLWSLLNPLLMLVIYSIAFKVILKIPIENFAIFVFTGLLPWMFFQGSISQSTNSIINNNNLIQKVYFPREIIPVSVVLANFINFLITLVVLFAALIFYKFEFGSAFFLLPIVFIINFLSTVGLSLFLSSMTVKYRDISHLVEVIFMAWFYLTPIIYSLDMVPEPFKSIILANPMTSIIELYRTIFMEASIPPGNVLWLGLCYSIIIFLCGLTVFKLRERKFAEEI
jgi:lipopolysaccharide transport system permease protein